MYMPSGNRRLSSRGIQLEDRLDDRGCRLVGLVKGWRENERARATVPRSARPHAESESCTSLYTPRHTSAHDAAR